MRFMTCDCEKHDMKCVKTGFRFNTHHDELMNGDLFLCRLHDTLSIQGVNPDPMGVADPKHSSYSGLLHERQHYDWPMSTDGWLHSMTGGVIDLCDADLEYIEKWDPIADIALLPPQVADATLSPEQIQAFKDSPQEHFFQIHDEKE